MIVTCFTYAMNTLRKEQRMSVKKNSKQQKQNFVVKCRSC